MDKINFDDYEEITFTEYGRSATDDCLEVVRGIDGGKTRYFRKKIVFPIKCYLKTGKYVEITHDGSMIFRTDYDSSRLTIEPYEIDSLQIAIVKSREVTHGRKG